MDKDVLGAVLGRDEAEACGLISWIGSCERGGERLLLVSTARGEMARTGKKKKSKRKKASATERDIRWQFLTLLSLSRQEKAKKKTSTFRPPPRVANWQRGVFKEAHLFAN